MIQQINKIVTLPTFFLSGVSWRWIQNKHQTITDWLQRSQETRAA